MFRSLRVQLFLGIFVILLGAGGIIMVSTQEEVEQALIDAENRSARNVLNLIELNVSTRYRELLMDKVRIVAERRSSLQQLGQVISATMGSFDSLVYGEVLSRAEAEQVALSWAAELQLGQSATAFAMDPQGRIVAHPQDSAIGRNLGAVEDLKGRAILRAIEEEIALYGYAFVIYEDTEAMRAGDDGRRFAYFMPVPAFGLYMGISDQIGDVEDYVQTGVEATIEVLGETVSGVQVVDTGFVFIFRDDLNPITPLPDWAAGLSDQTDPATGRRVLELFRDAGASGRDEAVTYTLTMSDVPRQMEAYVSYFRPLGWYIASTMPSAEVAAPATALVRRQVVIFAAVLSASLILAWFFATKITGPLQRLTAYARALPAHNFNIASTDQPALDRLGNARSEVGGLAQAFLFMERALRENIRALVQTTRAKERIESELNIAQDIQRGLLPKIFPPFPHCPQIDLHAALYPARHVGGDLFDFYFLDEHRLLFTVGDVADKGVPSALFMAITKTLVKSASSQDRDPARMMERVNADLSADNPSAMFVTLLIGILDIRTGVIDYVNAGQNPPILLSARTGKALFKRDISGPPGGAMEGVPYRLLSMQMEPGDMLVVYTDGITEAMSPEKAEYGNERLERRLGALSGATAETIVGAVIDDVRHHSAGEEQSDDITILCLSWRGEPSQDKLP